jgi:type VI protein secretion system component VasK
MRLLLEISVRFAHWLWVATLVAVIAIAVFAVGLMTRLGGDEAGLSLVAYALGAAFIAVPMAIALFLFGQQATSRADTDLTALLAASTPSLP